MCCFAFIILHETFHFKKEFLLNNSTIFWKLKIVSLNLEDYDFKPPSILWPVSCGHKHVDSVGILPQKHCAHTVENASWKIIRIPLLNEIFDHGRDLDMESRNMEHFSFVISVVIVSVWNVCIYLIFCCYTDWR